MFKKLFVSSSWIHEILSEIKLRADMNTQHVIREYSTGSYPSKSYHQNELQNIN